MENIQVKKLKLNATSIKSTLISGNKDLKKIRAQEKNLILQQNQKLKIKGKESSVEKRKVPGSGMLKNIGSKLTAPARSFIDRVKDFIGVVLFGILVNQVPRLINAVKKFLEDNKDIIDTIKSIVTTVGNALWGFIQVIEPFFGKQKEYDKESKELKETVDKFEKELDLTDSEFGEVEKKLKGEFDYESQTPEEIVENVRNEVVITRTEPVIYRQRMVKFRELKGKNLGTGERINLPGIGSFESRAANPIGKFFGLARDEDKYFDPDGLEIPQSQFMKRYDALQNSGNIDDVLKGYSQGGTIGSNLKLGSPRLKTASKSLSSFKDFQNNILTQNDILNVQEENNKTFDSIVNNFKGLVGLSEEINLDIDPDTGRPRSPDGPSQPYTGQVIPGTNTFFPLATPKVQYGNSAQGQAYGDPRPHGSHQGIDITDAYSTSDPNNQQVIAMRHGTVDFVDSSNTYPGGMITIDHGNGVKSKYIHVIPRSGLKRGDSVYGGQKIATLFPYTSNGVQMDHLHFELEKDGVTQDPTSIIEALEPSRLTAPLSDARAEQLHQKNAISGTAKELMKIYQEMEDSKPGDGSRHVIDGVGIFRRDRNGDKFFDDNGNPLTQFQFYDKLYKLYKREGLNNLIPTSHNSMGEYLKSSSTVPSSRDFDKLYQNFDDGEVHTAMLMVQQPIVMTKTRTQVLTRTQKEIIPIHVSSAKDYRRSLV